MKFYSGEKKEIKKSWSLFLDEERQSLIAVDSETGEWIATLIEFTNNGSIRVFSDAEEGIKIDGYDPYEHNNKFDDNGKIVIG